MLAITQHNFENTFINESIKLDNGTPSINWGFNSGGYEKFQYFVTAEGNCIAIDTVINEYHKINFNNPNDPQHYIVAVDVNWEDNELVDVITGEGIEPAYDLDEDCDISL